MILIPVLIFTLILGICTIEEKHEPEKVPVDIWGIIFIMLTFLGLVYGFANIAAFGKNPVVEIIAFAIGIVALVLFVKHCGKCENPLIDMSIFKNIPFVCHLVAFFLINAIMLGTSFLLPNYLQVALLCESMIAGFMLLPGAGLNALMGPFSGAALVAAAQMQNNSFSYEQKTAAGSTHGFIFLLIFAIVCLILQIVGFKKFDFLEK